MILSLVGKSAQRITDQVCADLLPKMDIIELSIYPQKYCDYV